MLTSARLPLLALALALSATAAEAQRAPGWIGIGFEVWSDDRGQSSVTVTEVLGRPLGELGQKLVLLGFDAVLQLFGANAHVLEALQWSCPGEGRVAR
jgi:hypothetical protein